jgi:geranylgeranyl pyrophosphate synthase
VITPATGPARDVAADFAADRAAVGVALEAAAERYLGGLPSSVSDAMRYAVLGEGKRLRAILFMAAYRAAHGEGNAAPLAASIEIVHAYSLVHDDLPCMDDDDIRRGRPTVHKAFGVRTATAAGLAMVPLAARLAFDAARALGQSNATAAEIVRELMHASGAAGMIGGQLLDLEGEGEDLSLERLERIHSLKTGALIMASARIGGVAAGASPGVLRALEDYGRCVGLAFQIADDVLDVTATTDQLGKTAGKDIHFRKSTYPALLGVEVAQERARLLAEEACAALRGAELLTGALEYLASFSVSRRS